MPLTSEEQRRLDHIERELSRDDPNLRRLLSTGQRRRANRRTVSKWLAFAGFVALIVGAVTAQAIVCLAAWAALALGVAVLFAPYLDLPPRSTQPGGPDRPRGDSSQ